MTDFFDPKDDDVVMQCDHCGRRTTFTIRDKYTFFTDAAEFPYSEKSFISWSIMQCRECLRPTCTESSQIVNGELTQVIVGPKTTILYPAEKTPLTNLPEAIEKKYMEALKIRNISPSSCAVQVRRRLEAICIHENAQGKVLAQKLKNLADSNRIPQTLADVASHLKQLGNLGAHFDEDEVSKEDVPIILDFLELLLEYLYVAPAKIEEVKNRLSGQS